ncbi:hypothetical protein [Piscinibacter koreensis]|uniref:Uncharacterized protein n=1 Tax=Piscinibacter koreensis TaxID=2742824 RepID=A0A7Y6TV17_9BURK|nr:hypothetical protein [Schlegelella koreensis]NUZ04595.1 hypothetical protein [Schlegelella koreensis]
MNDIDSLGDPGDTRSDAHERLGRVHGPGELQAALLALLLPPNSQRARRAWRAEVGPLPSLDELRADVEGLSGAARLPWFDVFLARMKLHAPEARQQLLAATRRVVAARGATAPIDQLHYLLMRKHLGRPKPLVARPEAVSDTGSWLESDVRSVAVYTGYLARMVPGTEADAGAAWYREVLLTWEPVETQPPFERIRSDAMLQALGALQTLSWMQRPTIVRSWVAAALQVGAKERLARGAADALRLSCALIDAPLPPELARHYVTLAPDA